MCGMKKIVEANDQFNVNGEVSDSNQILDRIYFYCICLNNELMHDSDEA